MKNFSREDIKNYLLNKLTEETFNIINFVYEMSKLDETEKKYYDQLIENLIDELYNVSNTKIGLLNERETFIIRKLLGILDNGQYQTQLNIGKSLNLSRQRISEIIGYDIFRKLRSSILSYEKAAISNEETITLSDPVQKLNLSLLTFIRAHRGGIITIEDFIAKSELELLKLHIITSFAIEEKRNKILTRLSENNLTEVTQTNTTNKPYIRKRKLN